MDKRILQELKEIFQGLDKDLDLLCRFLADTPHEPEIKEKILDHLACEHDMIHHDILVARRKVEHQQRLNNIEGCLQGMLNNLRAITDYYEKHREVRGAINQHYTLDVSLDDLWHQLDQLQKGIREERI